MTPSRPYYVRAVYEWLNDNNMTAHLLIDALCDGVQVPQQYVKDGRIVLNIAPGAVRDLFIRNEGVTFSARFGGVPMMISAPIQSVLAIYARENGQGMFFDNQDEFDPPPGDEAAPGLAKPVKVDGPGAAPAKKPSLRVVK